MSVGKIMKETIVEVRVVILSLEEVFTTHQFIRVYAGKHKRRYDDFLYLYRDKGVGAVQRVHSQMARFLTQQEAILGIERTRKVKSRNVLDKVVWVQEWRRVDRYAEPVPSTRSGQALPKAAKDERNYKRKDMIFF